MRTLKLSGHVGFDSLPDQLVAKSTQSGFTFNILCIGKFYASLSLLPLPLSLSLGQFDSGYLL